MSATEMNTDWFASKYGPWALITGASSGIGREFARQLAELGINCVLIARRENRLRSLAAELESVHKIKTRCLVVDLAQDLCLEAILEATSNLEIGLLVSSAGYSITGEFLEVALERHIDLLNVNSKATLMLTHTFAGPMKERGKGGIIVLSSISGFTAVRHWGSYCASKGYNLLLAETLATELKSHGVDVLALCPGTTRTEFTEIAGIGDFAPMDVDNVVRTAIKHLPHSRTLITGIINKAGVFVIRFLPRTMGSRLFSNILSSVWDKEQESTSNS